ncbi:MAG TPA: alpha/beta hydrolase [Candidatus Tectomicrobia bacterium]
MCSPTRQATDALILVDSTLGGWPPDPEFAVLQSAVRVRAKEASVQAARDVWLYSLLFNPALENPDVAPRLVQIISDYSGWHWVNPNPLRDLAPPATQRLGTISVPTLIIIGERDMPNFHAIADSLHQHIPKTRKVVMPGVGHMAKMEDPERFNTIVLDFLAEQ